MNLGIKMMKKILLGTVALFALAAPASAADLAARPYKAAPIAAPMMYDWSGFYIGANGGYGWARQGLDVTQVGFVNVFSEGCNDKGGGVIGGQIGYRWQAGTWVFGLEAQGDWANLRNERISLSTRRTPGNPTSMAWGSSRGRLVTPGTQRCLCKGQRCRRNQRSISATPRPASALRRRNGPVGAA